MVVLKITVMLKHSQTQNSLQNCKYMGLKGHFKNFTVQSWMNAMKTEGRHVTGCDTISPDFISKKADPLRDIHFALDQNI